MRAGVSKSLTSSVPNANESVVVKWLFEQTTAGRTPAEIADDANANGWRTNERPLDGLRKCVVEICGRHAK